MSLKVEIEVSYPIAYVLQSAAGAKAVIGIWSIVLAEMCSDVVGSKRMTFPWALPGENQHHTQSYHDFQSYQKRRCRSASMLPQ